MSIDSNECGIVMSFDSTQQALRAEMLMEYMDMEIDTFPTPKEITAGCALSIRFEAELLEQVKQLVRTEHVVIRGLFEWAEGTYQCIWNGGEES